ITPLVRQAYAAIYAHDPARQQERADELLAGIERLEAERRRRLGEDAERLVASPLLVRMLLIVHFSERRLPDQRAELYMKATDAMLLPDYATDEAIADEIGKLVGGSSERHRDLVQHIAYHMHSQGPEQGREIDEYELRRILSLEPAYREPAEAFIALTRLRGTIMEERLGTYRFLHLGFQEFLAARYLATVTAMNEGLAGVVRLLLGGPVNDSWWREPILLLCGYLSVTSPQAAARFLRQLGGLEALPGAPPMAEEMRWAAAEVAGSAAREWRGIPLEEQKALARRLADLLSEPQNFEAVPTTIRAAAGAALGGLGDPREEIVQVDRMQFCAVPRGMFWMGSADEDADAGDDEKPQHQVDIPYDYWIGRYPVSNAQYATFVEEDGYLAAAYWPEAGAEGFWRVEQGFKGFWDSEFRRGPAEYGPPFNLDNHPVVGVSWYEALAFTRWLTERWRNSGLLPGGLAVTLPGEAEWEKAARGGLRIPAQAAPVTAGQWETAGELVDNPLAKRRYPWGDDFEPDLANNGESGIGSTSALGAFAGQGNPYGVQEMSGNVWEWTRSLF
ncbi:MAG: formylglycine-generating enzyme family protein, partial [Candidatus Promineifilaceae bacterium]